MKVIKILFVSFLVLLLVGSFALHAFFPVARLRALAQSEIRAQLHRDVQLGDISLGLFGLTVDRLRLSEKPDFSAGTFLYVDRVKIRWALWPLLRHRLTLSAIELDKPQINLVRFADGKTLNINDLIQNTNQSPNRTTTAPPVSVQVASAGAGSLARPLSDWTWFVHEIRLEHGTIRFDDRSPARQSTSLSDIRLVLKDFDATHMQGKLTIDMAENAFYKAQDFSLEWALTEIDPTFNRVNGWARLKQGAGRINNISALVSSSSSARTLFLPLTLVQNLNRSGVLRIGGPDLNYWTLKSIVGDYEFERGTMRIQKFSVDSDQLSMQAGGLIQLASGQLAVDVSLQAPKQKLTGPLDVKLHLSGTLSHPITDLKSLKQQAFKASLKGLMGSPDVRNEVDKTFKKLFR
jgi:uncharacterized protein involved in outer membrane biogenesis